MIAPIQLGEISIEITKKKIKNIHLKVALDGSVRISAPIRMSREKIEHFARSKLDWIKKHLKKAESRQHSFSQDFREGESHFVWGNCYLLKIIPSHTVQKIEVHQDNIEMYALPNATKEKKENMMESLYRKELQQVLPSLMTKWEAIIKVKANQIFLQKMKTRWGSCNTHSGNIRFNTDLAKKPFECLEYVVVHELVHLLEPSHNHRFKALMDQFMPLWRVYRQQLKQL